MLPVVRALRIRADERACTCQPPAMPPPPPSSYRAPAELMEGAPIPGINMRSTMVSANNRDPNAPSWDAWKADIKSKEQKNLAMENWEKNLQVTGLQWPAAERECSPAQVRTGLQLHRSLLQNDHRFQLDVDREARMGGGGKKEKKKHKKHKKKHKHEKEKAASPMKVRWWQLFSPPPPPNTPCPCRVAAPRSALMAHRCPATRPVGRVRWTLPGPLRSPCISV